MLLILLVVCVGLFLGEGVYVVHLVSYLCCGFFVGGRGSMLLILFVFCVVFLVLFVFVLCIVPNVSCVS
jgi:hypothetical protein